MGSSLRHIARPPVLALLIAVACSVLLAAPTSIAPDAMLEHIKFLASDDLKGRADGSPELERAADYIAQAVQGRWPAAGRNEQRMVSAVSSWTPD